MKQEKRFEKRVREYLESKGAWVVKYFANACTPAGIPDLLCCLNGKFIAVEVKSTAGKPSVLQKITINRIQDAGGYACILYPCDFEKFKTEIEKLL